MSEPQDETMSILDTAIPCRHIRSTGMYVFTESNAPRPDEGCNSTVCWCLRSMKGYGPDDEPVDYDSCCNPGRSCYQPM